MTKKEKLANLEHALRVLRANHIDHDDGGYGWYWGNREQFIKRHGKAKDMLDQMILEAKNEKPQTN
jgi:hypothetical protein